MDRIRMLAAASVLAAMSVLAGPAAPAGANTCSEGDVRCSIWESPICREEVPKAIRAAAGCFKNQP